MHFQQMTNMAIPGARIPVPGVMKFTVLVYPSLLIITVCSMPRSRDENISMKKTTFSLFWKHVILLFILDIKIFLTKCTALQNYTDYVVFIFSTHLSLQNINEIFCVWKSWFWLEDQMTTSYPHGNPGIFTAFNLLYYSDNLYW